MAFVPNRLNPLSHLLPLSIPMVVSADTETQKAKAKLGAQPEQVSTGTAAAQKVFTSTPFSRPTLMPKGISAPASASIQPRFVTILELQKDYQFFSKTLPHPNPVQMKVWGSRFSDAKSYYIEHAQERMYGLIEHDLIKSELTLNGLRLKIQEYEIALNDLQDAVASNSNYSHKHNSYPPKQAESVIMPHFKAKIRECKKNATELRARLTNQIYHRIKELEECLSEGNFLNMQAQHLSTKVVQLKPQESGIKTYIKYAVKYFPVLIRNYERHILESRQYFERLSKLDGLDVLPEPDKHEVREVAPKSDEKKSEKRKKLE